MSEDIVWAFKESLKKFIRELHGVASHVNTPPNSLGRLDKHKIGFTQRQLHPSMIGLVDMLESSKDVGQSGMISPWADTSIISDTNINKYPNIKFELFKFIQENFDDGALIFSCDNIVEYNQILDKLVESSMINVDYKIKRFEDEEAE